MEQYDVTCPICGTLNVQETPWDDIAAEIGFCERHIYRLHKAAVEELDNRLKDVM